MHIFDERLHHSIVKGWIAIHETQTLHLFTKLDPAEDFKKQFKIIR